MYDLIVIDGAVRYECALVAVEKLAPNGLLILDNTEWFPNTANMLLEKGFHEIAFSGFSPNNAFTSKSSVFFRSGTEFAYLPAMHEPPVGGKYHPLGGVGDEPAKA
jgi:hypothetical protein